jgi:sialate O-acetylesterase
MMGTARPHAVSPARRALPALALALLCAALPAQARGDRRPLLHALFQDHAVLQRDRPIAVWGNAAPGVAVEVSLAGRRVRARADADGEWEARLPPLAAGGPYTLVASAGAATQQVGDVLVGDVWLCSGQSNMDLPVKRTLNARAEIDGARNDRIRMLKVDQVESAVPRTGFATPVPWRKTTPETVPGFSAACYYFARELQKTVDVPMGLVDASWGGARIEAWMSASALRRLGGYDDALDVLADYARDPAAANARWGKLWTRWWRGRPGVAEGDAPWDPRSQAGDWRAAPQALGNYREWSGELSGFTGMLWYRTTVELSAEQAARPATLALGVADEVDETWVNGRAVGSSYGGAERSYALPHGLLHEGANTIAVNVLNTYADGGLTGPASSRALRLADGTSVPLDGAWMYRVVPDSVGTPPVAPWLSASGKTTLYNGMVAPLGRFGFRGALWYQGESNTGEPDRYRTLLRAYRDDLRAQFGAGLPLLVVQLAGYGDAPTRPVESGWAGVREAQRLAVAGDAHSGLAVAIDIGERSDIHPPNKQELGRRLARAARHVVYGEELPPSGPVPLSARRLVDADAGEAVAVSFGDVTGKLVAYGYTGPIGFELCGEQAGSCRYAVAAIRGNDVVLRAPVARATRVRYGWADSPVVTLYDAAALPAGPFELAIP